MSQQQPQVAAEGEEVPPQKTEQQLLEQQKIRQEEERAKEEQRKRLEQQARIKTQQDIKKLQQALKGSLSGLGKTHDNRTMAYLKLNLAQKQLQRVFPSMLKYSQIKYLDINTNAISDPSILTQFTHLVSLNVSKNQIGNLDAFNTENLSQLQILNISGNKIKLLTEITLPSLRRLNLTENQIASVQWKGHANIEILQLRKNKLRKLKGISNLKKLRQLYVDQNQVTDIRGLQNVPLLEKLHFRNNKIKDFLQPFPHVPNAQSLNIRQNQLVGIDILGKIPVHIREINFIANPLAQELGENAKKQVIWKFPHFSKVNKSEVTTQDKLQFDKQWKQKQAERQKERLQKQAAQEEARKLAAQEEAAKQQQGKQES